VIDHAIKALSEGSEVGVNIPHRVNRVFGRQLSVVGLGSIRSMVAVFDYKGRLYQIEGKSVSTDDDAAAIRFVQSLVSPAAIRIALPTRFGLRGRPAEARAHLKSQGGQALKRRTWHAAMSGAAANAEVTERRYDTRRTPRTPVACRRSARHRRDIDDRPRLHVA